MAHAPDDELLSALLDGELGPGDAAHVATCNTCQHRMEALRAAAIALATPVTPPPGHVREAAMREALLTAEDRRRGGTRRPSTLRDRSAPSDPRRRTSSLSAAAALLVAVLVGGWALSMLGRGGGTTIDQATLAAPSADDAKTTTSPEATRRKVNGADFSSAQAGLGADAASGTGAGSGAAPYDAGDIGAFDSVNSVATRADRDLSQPADVVDASRATSPSACPYASTDGASVSWQATLRYQGRAAVAHYVRRDDSQVMEILALQDCSLIARQDSAPTSPR